MLNKAMFVSFLALTSVWVSIPAEAMDLPLNSSSSSSTSSGSVLTAKEKQDLFARAKQGDRSAQDRLVDTFYLGLWDSKPEETPLRNLSFVLWDNIQERCSTNPKYAFFVLNLLSRKRINENFPTLLPTIKRKANEGDPQYAHLEGWRWLKDLTTMVDHPCRTGKMTGVALDWFRKAGKLGVARADYDLAHGYYGYDIWYHYHYFVEITTALQNAAKHGFVIADLELGNIFQAIIFTPKEGFNRGVQEFHTEENAALAVSSLEKAAKAGFSEAQYNLGLIFKKQGKPQDAIYWLTEARKNGQMRAESRLQELGVVYTAEKKIIQASSLAVKSSPKPRLDTLAAYQMAHAYFVGNGVKKDYKESLGYFYYTKEVIPDSFYMLGLHYLNGLGVSKSQEVAFQKFKRSARKGDPKAQSMLGVMYQYGHGIESNLGKSLFWYTQSKLNDPNVKAFLRNHLRFGLGPVHELSSRDMVECWPDAELNALIAKYEEEEKNPKNTLVPFLSKDILHATNNLKHWINCIREATDYTIILTSYMSPELKTSLLSNKNPKSLTFYQHEDQNFVIFSKTAAGSVSALNIYYKDSEKVDSSYRQALKAKEDLDNCLLKGVSTVEEKLTKKLKAINDRQESINNLAALMLRIMEDSSDEEEAENLPLTAAVPALPLTATVQELLLSAEAQGNVGEQSFRTARERVADDKEMLKNIEKKIKQSIFARGLKNQKDFLEAYPIYKE